RVDDASALYRCGLRACGAYGRLLCRVRLAALAPGAASPRRDRPKTMTRKRRRLIMLLVCGVCLGSAAALALFAFRDNMVFFLAPADIAQAPSGRSFRLGGLVEAGSLEQSDEGGRPAARFRVTDGRASVTVSYVGILPDLFREGQGVVALGE